MALTIDTTTLEGGPSEVAGLGDLKGSRMALATMKVTFDSSYATGGEALSLSNYFDTVLAIWPTTKSQTYYVSWDNANDKLIAYTRADDLQVANTTDLSTLVCYLLVLGQGV